MKYSKLPCEFTEMVEEELDVYVRPVPVTGCIYHLNNEKPTIKWSFLMKLEPDFTLMMRKLRIACGIKDSLSDMNQSTERL